MSLLSKVAKAAVKTVQNTAKDLERKRERIDRYKEKYYALSDEELRRRYKATTDGERKIAIAEIIKERHE